MRFRTSTLALISSASLLIFGVSQIVDVTTVSADQVNDLSKQVDNARKDFDGFKQKVSQAKLKDGKYAIPVSKEYAQALKDFFNYKLSDAQRSNARMILDKESEKFSNWSPFDGSFTVESFEEYEVNNLPQDVKVELSYFALDLVNQIRRQVGTQEVSLSVSSLEFADKVSKEYVKGASYESIYSESGHYAKGINRVAKEYGLKTTDSESEKRGQQFYENLFSGFSPNFSKRGWATKQDLKEQIYQGLLGMLYNGVEYYHAQSITGVKWTREVQKEYFGYAPSYSDNSYKAHYIFIGQDFLDQAIKNNFSGQSVNDTTLKNRKESFKKLGNELEKKEKNYTNLKKQLDELNKQKDSEKRQIVQTEPSQSQVKPSRDDTKPSQSKTVKNGWQKESGFWYYYDNDQRLKNTWKGSYYLKSDGRMAESEWIYDNSYKAWYYLKSNGIYVRDSWQGSYYLKSNGKMADKEWIYDNYYQSWFYLKEGGAYVNHQWLKIDGVWYYFKSGGYMVSNAWQGSYYLKSSGAMAVNEWIYDIYWGGWYYLKSDGSYARNEIVQGKYRVDYSGKWV